MQLFLTLTPSLYTATIFFWQHYIPCTAEGREGEQKPCYVPPALLSLRCHRTSHSLFRVLALFLRTSQIPHHFFLVKEFSVRGFTIDPNPVLMQATGLWFSLTSNSIRINQKVPNTAIVIWIKIKKNAMSRREMTHRKVTHNSQRTNQLEIPETPSSPSRKSTGEETRHSPSSVKISQVWLSGHFAF